MANIFYSPLGNPEMWETCPDGYFSEATWLQKEEVAKKEREDEEYKKSLLPQNLYPVKYKEIVAAYEKALAKLTNKYPEMEQTTFYRQLSEANNILNSVASDTPFIDNAAIQRGVSRQALAQSINDNADTYAAISGYLTGKKYKLLKDLGSIDTATTESLLNLNIDFSVVDEEVV